MRREESPWYAAGFTREWWKALSPDDQKEWLAALTDEEAESYFRDWRVWAREGQIPPDNRDAEWDTWLMCCGRNFGKTRAAVEWLLGDYVHALPPGTLAIVGQGKDDIRKVMIEGASGLVNCSPSWNKPKFYPSVAGGTLIWPNGWRGDIYSAEDTEALRGPQFHAGWFDEPMAVPAEKRQRASDNLEMCLRLGEHPQLALTTTPKPHRWMIKALKDAEDPENKVFVSRGVTSDNTDSPASFQKKIHRMYGGTRLGRQELGGELLQDEEGALWTAKGLDDLRRPKEDPYAVAKTCEKIVVGVDPNMKDKGTAHEAGIIVAGRRGKERLVLADRTVGGGPAKWARAAVLASDEFGANEIYCESNQGGDLVKMAVYQMADAEGVLVKVVLGHAQKSKIRRAEPAATLYDRGLVHHIGPADSFDALETQMTAVHDNHDPTGEDFDRLDALVHALTRLGLKANRTGSGSSTGSGAGFHSFNSFG